MGEETVIDCKYREGGSCRLAAEKANMPLALCTTNDNACQYCLQVGLGKSKNNKVIASTIQRAAQSCKQEIPEALRAECHYLLMASGGGDAAQTARSYAPISGPAPKRKPNEPLQNRCSFRSKEPLRSEPCSACNGVRHIDIFECQLFGECKKHSWKQTARGPQVKSCATCDYLGTQFETPRRPERTWHQLKDNYDGCGVFLLGSGPSLNDMPLELLQQRGIMTAAMNLVGATHIRPDFSIMVDSPDRFHEAIWNDPRITKLVRHNKSRSCVRRRTADGKWEYLDAAFQYPSVFTYREEYMEKGFVPKLFLQSEKIFWGGRGLLPKNRPRRTVSVTIAAIKLLIELGFKRIYLGGTDWQMSHEGSYAFTGNDKHPNAAGTNTNTYTIMSEFFTRLDPVLRKRGIYIYNCTPGSRLHSFEKLDLEEAVMRERAIMGLQHLKSDEDINVEGYYGP
jgi:hypothetical protein